MRLFLFIDTGEDDADEFVNDNDNEDAADGVVAIESVFDWIVDLVTFDIDLVIPVDFFCIGDDGVSLTNKDAISFLEFFKFISFVDFVVCIDCFLLINCLAQTLPRSIILNRFTLDDNDDISFDILVPLELLLLFKLEFFGNIIIIINF